MIASLKFAFTIPAMIDSGGTSGPCTQEDRDKIVAAALERAAQMRSCANGLDKMASTRHWTEPDRVVLLVAAAQLRQLAES